MSLDPETLARAGRLLAGEDWQRPLARLLGPRHPDGAREAIDDRLVRRWAVGDRPVADWVPAVLADLLRERAAGLAQESRAAAALARELGKKA